MDMDIKSTTVYTRERLIRFSDYFARMKMTGWIIYAVLTAIIIAGDVFLFLHGALTEQMIFLTALAILIDLLMVFMFVILPRLTVKKTNSYEARLNYSFSEEEVHLESEGKLFRDSTSFKYGAIEKAAAYKDDLYLFISKRQAYIVDLSAMSADDVSELRSLLAMKIPANKIKW